MRRANEEINISINLYTLIVMWDVSIASYIDEHIYVLLNGALGNPINTTVLDLPVELVFFPGWHTVGARVSVSHVTILLGLQVNHIND